MSMRYMMKLGIIYRKSNNNRIYYILLINYYIYVVVYNNVYIHSCLMLYWFVDLKRGWMDNIEDWLDDIIKIY